MTYDKQLAAGAREHGIAVLLQPDLPNLNRYRVPIVLAQWNWAWRPSRM
jgi:hypothetical protein